MRFSYNYVICLGGKCVENNERGVVGIIEDFRATESGNADGIATSHIRYLSISRDGDFILFYLNG